MNETVMSTTFEVSDVKKTTGPLPELPYHEAVSSLVHGPVEACSKYHGHLIANMISHPLIAALHGSFCLHRPLILSPDIVWLTLTQGLARHINQNAEKLRKRFVSHEGKVKITVHRDDFIKGSSENAWPEVFSAFSEQIRDHIGKVHDLIVADFQTTGPVEKAASEVVLLDLMQSYFEYELLTICGIPSITLEGTVDDWRMIAARAERFKEFNLNWWISPLLPVCNQFVDAAACGRITGSRNLVASSRDRMGGARHIVFTRNLTFKSNQQRSFGYTLKRKHDNAIQLEMLTVLYSILIISERVFTTAIIKMQWNNRSNRKMRPGCLLIFCILYLIKN